MNKRLILVFLMIFVFSLSLGTVFCIAQQSNKEIDQNEAEQIKTETEMADKELMDIDLQAEQDNLQSQNKSIDEAEDARIQIDSEIVELIEDADKEANEQIEILDKEAQDQTEINIQESEEDSQELRQQAQNIELDLATQE